MAFQPDRTFESMEDACAFVLDQQARRPVGRLRTKASAKLVVPREVPRYVFRGENGSFATTVSSAHRSDFGNLKEGGRLSPSDLKTLTHLLPYLVDHFVRNETYSLTEPQAHGLLQHYGLPTTVIDFTGDLTNAFAFAASGVHAVGMVAVLTLPNCLERVVDFTDHPWAERAQRQGAFGVVPPDGLIDLKSEVARSQLGLSWYEFPVSPSDRDHLRATSQEPLRWIDDPSAGFLRFHVTEYVEAHGKFSPELTGWLLDRVLIAPYCCMAESFEGKDVVVYFRSAKDLPAYDESAERECSRRYWSSAYPKCFSGDALKAFSWRQVGEITL